MNYTEQDMDTLHNVLTQLNPDHLPWGVRWEYYVNINVDPEAFQTIQLRLVFCRNGTPVLCFASEVAYALNTTVHRIASQIQARLHNLYMQHYDKLADPKLLSLLSGVDVAAIPYDLVNRGSIQQAEAYASARLHSVLGANPSPSYDSIITGRIQDIDTSMWMPAYGKTGGHHAEYAVRDIANRTNPFEQVGDNPGQACSWKRPLASWTKSRDWYMADGPIQIPAHLWLLSPNGNSKDAEWMWAHRVPGHNALECQHDSSRLDDSELVNMALVALDTVMLLQPNINIQASPALNSFAMLGCVEMSLNGEWWAAVVHNDEVALKKFITANTKQGKTHLFKVRKVD